MSAEQSSPTALPPVGRSDGESAQGTSGEVPQSNDLSAAGEPQLPIAIADLANLLAHGQWSDTPYGLSAHGNHSYDGHVALALDTGDLPDIDSTLDLLTSSHHLFDVPALDVSAADDASST